MEKIADHLIANGITMAPQWISVEERLPEDGMFVLVIAYGQIENITLKGAYQLATYYASDGFVLSEFPLLDDVVVTHWMPLPEPPEATS